MRPADVRPRTARDGALADSFEAVAGEIAGCRACPRLVAWREAAAGSPPRRFAGESYWARPIPGFGDAAARIALVGLAPAAHGGNRTGRMFTGDRSGDFLFASLHRAGLANRPASVRRGDGLELTGAFITAAVRCAPPANRPLPDERDRCAPFLHRELALLPELRVIVALGAFGWDAALRAVEAMSGPLPRPLPRFGHGAEAAGGPWRLLGTYHPSQQNVFTRRLTAPMIDAVLSRAIELAGVDVSGHEGEDLTKPEGDTSAKGFVRLLTTHDDRTGLEDPRREGDADA